MKKNPPVFSECEEKFIWVRRNRGVCSRIAEDHGVSRAFVSRVLYGIDGARSSDLSIEKALIAAGAPFLRQRIEDVA